MAKFDVFESGVNYPKYFCQIQDNYHDHLYSRVVIPLFDFNEHKSESQDGLTPRVSVNDIDYLVMTPEMASVPRHALGKKVTNLEQHDFEITRAVDFLMQGF